MARETRMTQRVLTMLGRMPTVPFRMLSWLVSSSRLTPGAPRKRIYPMRNSSRAQVSPALSHSVRRTAPL